MKRNLHINNDFKKTYLFPAISSLVMGAGAFLIHMLLSMLFALFVPGEYFVNLFATILAVLAAVLIYFTVLIKSGGATREDILRFPKGRSIVSALEKIRIL